MGNRVWHVVSNRWNSAITEYALSSARAFELLGAESVVTGLEGKPFAIRARKLGFPVLEMPHFKLQQVSRFRRYSKILKPDLVIYYGGSEMLVGSLARLSIPQVRFFGSQFVPESRFAKIRTRISLNHIDGVVCPNNSLLAVYSKIMKGPSARIALGIDHTGFETMMGQRERGKPVVLMIFGRFDPVKGHIEFLRLYKSMLDAIEGKGCLKLLIVGEEANLTLKVLMAECSRLQLRIPEQVEIKVGRILDVPGLLQQADIGVISSLGSEMICRVGVEFLMSGKPVLISNIGGLKELLNGSNGMVYNHLNPCVSDLVSYCNLMTKQTDAYPMKVRQDAIDRFSLEAMSKSWYSFCYGNGFLK